MAQENWTEPALNDLNKIAQYVTSDKPGAAKKLLSSVFKSVKRLKDFPQSGKKPSEFPDTNYREVIVRPCRVETTNLNTPPDNCF